MLDSLYIVFTLHNTLANACTTICHTGDRIEVETKPCDNVIIQFELDYTPSDWVDMQRGLHSMLTNAGYSVTVYDDTIPLVVKGVYSLDYRN
jgi:hypothetical protein